MSFAFIARAEAAVFAVLFVILCFFPASYAPVYGVAADEAAQFITRRAAPMFLAPMVILWVAGGCPRSGLRDAVAAGVALMMLGIAATGVLAWAQGIAAPTILLAAAAEVLMAALLWLARKN